MAAESLSAVDAAALGRIAQLSRFDPLRFVRAAFPWGRDGLAGMAGPDAWQTDVLSTIGRELQAGGDAGAVVRIAVASGHGVGKSALVAWLILWALATAVDTRGVVTAETQRQLESKTWAELAKWLSLSVFRPWFRYEARSIYSVEAGRERTWRVDAIPWSESKPEGFAGLHNQGKRILVVFDEASAISEKIWEVTEGALTDKNTEILWCVFGNPTRSNGRFYDCFNRLRQYWITRHVDSRTSAVANQDQIAQWLEAYGEDSDFFKIRVRGVFPSVSSMQFIGRDIVEKAMSRPSVYESPTRAAAIIGVDVARFGDDDSVIAVRLAQDGRTFPILRLRHIDGWALGGRVVEVRNNLIRAGVRQVYINIDAGGVGASLEDWLTQNGYSINAINFGSAADDPRRYRNKRAEMWGRMRDWIKAGGCLPADQDLLTDLTNVEYGYSQTQQIQLEKKEDMKKRGLASPDIADAFALTFAVRVQEYLDELPRPARTRRPEDYGPRDPFRRR